MEDHEYQGYRIPELLKQDRLGGIEILRFAIEDMGVPLEAESERFEATIREIVQRPKQGQNVVVYCRGGLGRTGTVAACVLIVLHRHSADQAIAAVRFYETRQDLKTRSRIFFRTTLEPHVA